MLKQSKYTTGSRMKDDANPVSNKAKNDRKQLTVGEESGVELLLLSNKRRSSSKKSMIKGVKVSMRRQRTPLPENNSIEANQTESNLYPAVPEKNVKAGNVLEVTKDSKPEDIIKVAKPKTTGVLNKKKEDGKALLEKFKRNTKCDMDLGLNEILHVKRQIEVAGRGTKNAFEGMKNKQNSLVINRRQQSHEATTAKEEGPFVEKFEKLLAQHLPIVERTLDRYINPSSSQSSSESTYMTLVPSESTRWGGTDMSGTWSYESNSLFSEDVSYVARPSYRNVHEYNLNQKMDFPSYRKNYESDNRFEEETGIGFQNTTDTDLESKTDIVSGSKTDLEAEGETDIEAESKTNNNVGSNTSNKVEKKSNNETESKINEDGERKNNRKSERKTNSERKKKRDIEAEGKIASRVERTSDPESDGERENDRKSERKTNSERKKKRDIEADGGIGSKVERTSDPESKGKLGNDKGNAIEEELVDETEDKRKGGKRREDIRLKKINGEGSTHKNYTGGERNDDKSSRPPLRVAIGIKRTTPKNAKKKQIREKDKAFELMLVEDK